MRSVAPDYDNFGGRYLRFVMDIAWLGFINIRLDQRQIIVRVSTPEEEEAGMMIDRNVMLHENLDEESAISHPAATILTTCGTSPCTPHLSFSSISDPHVPTCKVGVWWDMESAPPPAGLRAPSADDQSSAAAESKAAIDALVTQALRLSCGLYGPVAVNAYGASLAMSSEFLEQLKERGIALKQIGSIGSSKAPDHAVTTARRMLADLLLWVLDHPPPMHIVLISSAHDSGLMALLLELHVRNYTILISSKFPAPPIARSIPPTVEPNHSHCPSPLFKKVTNRPPVGHLQPSQLLHGRHTWGSLTLVSVDGQVPFNHIMPHGSKQLPISPASPHGSSKADGCGGNSVSRVATLEDVRMWLHLFASSERGVSGLELKSVVHTFERENHDMRLDVISLGFKGLNEMLKHFPDIVQITRPRTFTSMLHPVIVDPQRSARLRADVKLLLARLQKEGTSCERVEIPIASLKERFKASFGYELDHEAIGYQTLHKFILSMPELNVKIERKNRQSKIMTRDTRPRHVRSGPWRTVPHRHVFPNWRC